MISKYNHKTLSWIDLESPSKEELNHTIEELSIPESMKEEIGNGLKDDIVHIDYDYIFVSINKIVFIVNDNFVLTIHNIPLPAFSKFSKELELDITTDEKLKINNNKLLFAHLLKSLYTDLETQLKTFSHSQECENVTKDSGFELENLKKEIAKKNKNLKTVTALLVISLGIIMLIFLYVINYI